MPVVDAVETVEAVVETPPRRQAERNEDRRPASRSNNAPDRRPAEPRNAEPRTAEPRQQDDRRYPPRDRGAHDRVVGMGDHVPDFILRSFRIATPATEETEDETSGSETANS